MNVTIFLVDGVADFGFAALLETFNTANALREEVESAPEPWQVRSVALGRSVRSGHGHTVPTTPIDDLAAVPGMLVVPAVNALGAEELTAMVSAPEYRPVLQRIQTARHSGAHLAAACTGTFFLAEAGVLDGSRATTSWWLGPSFRRRYPLVSLDESLTLCRGDRVTTAGASLSHLDLALSLVQGKSPALAERVGRYLAAGNRKSQSHFSIPEVVARGNSLTAAFERWVRERIDQPFQIGQAAAALGVAERSLQRATQAELGMSPRDFVDDVRLERATHLLRTTTLTVDAVATKVGYLNGSTLRSLVRRRRNMSLSELRSSPLAW